MPEGRLDRNDDRAERHALHDSGIAIVVGGDRGYFLAAEIPIDREMPYRIDRERIATARREVLNLRIPRVEIVAVGGTELEVPHDLLRNLGIVHIKYRERQASQVIRQLAVGPQPNLRGILLGRNGKGGGQL